MQFTTGLLTLTLAIAGAAAAPSAVEERQNTGLFSVQFFTGNDCQGSIVDSHTFADVNDQCQAAPERVRSYPSFRVSQTTGLTRTIFILKSSDCSTEKGEAPLAIPHTVPISTCFTHKVGSAFFGSA